MFDIEHIRSQFPILKRTVNGKPLIYFDNGATTQKPKQVIDRIVRFYESENANIHRGVHTLSREATEMYEKSRNIISSFIGAKPSEIIFTAGTTDSINIVANGIQLQPGSEIIVSQLEHHSNILPWQLWCEKNKGKLKVVPINVDGTLKTDELQSLLSSKTGLVALTHVSNTLGVINPVEEIIRTVKKFNPEIKVLIDGAQSTPHMKTNVSRMGADFFAFSGHKVYAPTGIGVLYVKEDIIDQLALSRTGGGTIKSVTFESTEYVEGPLRFEAGTPNIEAVLGLAEAVNYVNEIGMDNLFRHEHEMVTYAQEQLRQIEEIEIYSALKDKAAVISFNVKNQHPFDVGTLLDKYGIAVRTGHHCTQPLMQYFGIQGTIRASFAVYNRREEIDVFIESLKKTIKMLS